MIPRPEYPSVQFSRKEWVNLNGEWEFERDRSVSGKERGLHKAETLSEKITVPFCMESELSGIGDKDFCNCVWYKKTVDISEDWLRDKKRIILHIGACDYKTKLYVNGEYAGEHRGGYISFSFDITEFLSAGKNILTLYVRDDIRTVNQPAGKQSDRYESYGCFYTRTTGIWQTVWLENIPFEHIINAKYYPNTETSELTIIAKVSAPDGKKISAVSFFDGREAGTDSTTVCNGIAILKIKLSELHLWDIGKGNLYDLKLVCGKDEISSYFGMRSIRTDENGTLILNGRKIFQRLVLDQGFYPDGIYTAPTEEALIADIERSIAMGFDGARLHEKVFEERFLYHCDRLGYIVWGEYPNWGADISRPHAYKGFLPEWQEVIERDFNHPSIIGWCPLNETKAGQDNDFLRDIVKLTKALDSTRPVIDTSGWRHVEGLTDIMDWHDYDQNPESFKARYNGVANGEPIKNIKHGFELYPTFISEYGGIKWDVNSNLNNAWGYGDAPKTEEEFLERFKGLTEALLFNKFINGLCYTQLTDVEQETNGLYTYDRQAKFAPEFFKKVLSQKAACEE